jgi:repressor LexA
MSDLAQRIKHRRESLGLTQAELGTAIGKDQRSIWRYESEKVKPNAEVLSILARELRTTADYLLGLTDDPEKPLRSELDLDDLEREIVKLVRSQPQQNQERMLAVLKAMSATA